MRPNLVISCPATSRSGYGDHSRDLIRSLIAMDKFNVSVLDQRWGGCSRDALKESDVDISSRLIRQMADQPDIWIQVTVPNEFSPIGKYNIGITAGIETTLVSVPFLQGVNKMDYVLVPSKHAKDGFTNSTYDQKDKAGNTISKLECTTKIDILFEGLDITKFYKEPSSNFDLSSIKEDFTYLAVGHWLNGDFSHDRKDMGGMIRTFLETFKDMSKKNQPALILKTSSATFSVIDRESILKKIKAIRSSVQHTGELPNVYLLHGDLTEQELNELYNHPKVKAMISFTHGEGFGRPLLEFSITGKPVIASNWSGHIDFLSEYGLQLAGELKPVHKSVVWKDVIVPESQWFYVDYGYASGLIKDVYKQYKKYLEKTRKQTQYVKDNFTIDKMTDIFTTQMEDNVPSFEIKIPKLEEI